MTQIEITEALPLLNDTGGLTRSGWARQPHWRFDAAAVQVARAQLRQWDFFTVMDNRLALSLTMANLGFGGFVSAEALTFDEIDHKVNIRPFRRTAPLVLSERPGGSAHWQGRGRSHMTFKREAESMILDFRLERAAMLPELHGRVGLDWPYTQQSLACVFPFREQTGGFFYECKAPAIPASGTVMIGHRRHDFAAGSTFAVMDWGRGVWPRKVFWRWGAVTGRADGRTLGINLGNGFGDTSAGTENILLVDGIAHKLGVVDWHLNRKDYLAPWRIVAPDGRLTMTFTPVYDQHSNLNLIFKGITAHRVWGHYAGTALRDDGTRLTLPPTLGFAEEVWIQW